MATTVATINESLVDSKVVEALRYILPAFNAFSFRPEKTGKIKSDVVYVPVATDPTAQSKTPGTALTGNGTIAGVSITMSNFYGARWDFNEGEIAGDLAANAIADKVAGACYSIAKQVVDAALATITAAHFSDVAGTDKLVCAVGDFGQSDLALLWQYAETKIKQRQRTLILNAPYSAALLGESNLGLIFATSGTNFVQSGLLPQLIGMNTLCYAGLPSNSENLAGAVVGKAAIGVATAPPSPLLNSGDGDCIESRIITEPDSGLSVRLITFGDSGKGNISGEVQVLYGVDKVQDAVVRLVSA